MEDSNAEPVTDFEALVEGEIVLDALVERVSLVEPDAVFDGTEVLVSERDRAEDLEMEGDAESDRETSGVFDTKELAEKLRVMTAVPVGAAFVAVATAEARAEEEEEGDPDCVLVTKAEALVVVERVAELLSVSCAEGVLDANPEADPDGEAVVEPVKRAVKVKLVLAVDENDSTAERDELAEPVDDLDTDLGAVREAEAQPLDDDDTVAVLRTDTLKVGVWLAVQRPEVVPQPLGEADEDPQDVAMAEPVTFEDDRPEPEGDPVGNVVNVCVAEELPDGECDTDDVIEFLADAEAEREIALDVVTDGERLLEPDALDVLVLDCEADREAEPLDEPDRRGDCVSVLVAMDVGKLVLEGDVLLETDVVRVAGNDRDGVVV